VTPAPPFLARSLPPPARARLSAGVALGITLAPRGALVKIAAGVAGLTTLGGVATVLTLAARGSGRALAEIPAAASSALAWGAGLLVAVAASVQAFREDRARGVRALLLARGAGTGLYARGRVIGLALVLGAVVGGGTLVAGGSAVLAASQVGSAAGVLQSLIASLVFAAAFATVLAPLALAALGGRSRSGGYATFLALLVLPELLEPWTSELLPAGWGDLLAVPSALAALRGSLLPPGIDPARLARALVVIATFALVAFLAVRTEIARTDSLQEPPGR
jgi:hypothetical protein